MCNALSLSPDLIVDSAGMSAEEFGAYCLLLFATWRNDGQALADDDARLARVCRVSVDRWRKRIRPVLADLFDLSKGCWRHARLERDFAALAARQAKRSEIGVKAATARWSKLPKSVDEPLPPEKLARRATKPDGAAQPPAVVAAAGQEAVVAKLQQSLPLLASDNVIAFRPPDPEPAKKARGRGRATRLAKDFEMPAEWVVDGSDARRRHNLPPIDIALQAELFTNYWIARPDDAGAAKIDWHRTWTNWCLSAKAPPIAVAAGPIDYTNVKDINVARVGAALAIFPEMGAEKLQQLARASESPSVNQYREYKAWCYMWNTQPMGPGGG